MAILRESNTYEQKDILLNKSKNNLVCSEKYSEIDFNIAVSRRYYSVLQYLKYIAIVHMDFKPENKYGIGDLKSSHINIIECIRIGLEIQAKIKYSKNKEKIEYTNKVFKGIIDNFDSIKELRKKADYFAENINKSEYDKVVKICNKITEKVKEFEEGGVFYG